MDTVDIGRVYCMSIVNVKVKGFLAQMFPGEFKITIICKTSSNILQMVKSSYNF